VDNLLYGKKLWLNSDRCSISMESVEEYAAARKRVRNKIKRGSAMEAAKTLGIVHGAVYGLLCRGKLRLDNGSISQESVEKYAATRRQRRKIEGLTEYASFKNLPHGLTERLTAAARSVGKNKTAGFIEAVEEWCEKVEKGRK